MQMYRILFTYAYFYDRLIKKGGEHMGVGTNLKKILDERHMKVSELARKADVTPQTIYAIIKRDNETVKPEILYKLTTALGIPASDLIGVTNIEFNLSKIYKAIEKTMLEQGKIDKEKMWENYFLEQDILNSDNKERHHLLIHHHDTLNRIGRDALLDILSNLKFLNDTGIEEAIKRVEELTYIDKYKK